MSQAKNKSITRRKAPHTDAGLPFMKSRGRGNGINYWAVDGRADGPCRYTEDCELGRKFATAYFEQEPWTNGAKSDLASIVLDMIANHADTRKGLVVGFFGAVADQISIARAVRLAIASRSRTADVP